MTSDQRHGSPQQENGGAPRNGAPRASIFGSLTRALNVVGTVLILAMAIAVNADVTGRNLFNHPLPGVLEFVSLAIVAIVFLQMANTLREDRHVSNDIVVNLIVQRSPRLAAAIYAIFNLIGAILMAMIVWFVWPVLVNNYVGGYYRGAANVVEVPIWPFYVAVLVGAAATAVQYALLTLRAFRRAAGYEPT